MSFLRFQKYKELYFTMLPLMTIYPTLIGIDAGTVVNEVRSPVKSFDKYSNLVGYASIGILTGITYPISYPLFACYVLYK
jgi:hypothetical protein